MVFVDYRLVQPTSLVGAMYSDLLEVNDQCTKVRPIKPLPQWLLCSPTTKLLLAWNLSEMQSGQDRGSKRLSLSERFLQKFSAYGNITSSWILHPGKAFVWWSLIVWRQLARPWTQNKCKVKGVRVVPLGFQSTHHTKNDESSEERNEDQPEEYQSKTSGYLVLGELSSLLWAPDNTPSPVQAQFIDHQSRSPPAVAVRLARLVWITGTIDSHAPLETLIKTVPEPPGCWGSCLQPWNHKASGHLNGPERCVSPAALMAPREAIKGSLRSPGISSCSTSTRVTYTNEQKTSSWTMLNETFTGNTKKMIPFILWVM